MADPDCCRHAAREDAKLRQRIAKAFWIVLGANKTCSGGTGAAQIATAQRVFVSNDGVDGNSFYVLKKGGEAARPYHLFYAGTRGWGRCELAPTRGRRTWC
jgi:hypothetical protein